MHIQIYSSRRIPIFSRISVESNRKKTFAFRGSPLGCPAGTPDITFLGLNSSFSPTSIAPHSHQALHLPVLCRAPPEQDIQEASLTLFPHSHPVSTKRCQVCLPPCSSPHCRGSAPAVAASSPSAYLQPGRLLTVTHGAAKCHLSD